MHARRWCAIAAFAAAASGCGDEPRSAGAPVTTSEPAATATVDPGVERALRRPGVARLLRGCPVTRPNHDIPPGQEGNPGAELADYHGEGGLWTVLPPQGVLVAAADEVRADGSIARKFPWWRGERGELGIAGRRLDAQAPPLRADIPSGYGPTGFQASAIVFPAEGCWEVAARAGP